MSCVAIHENDIGTEFIVTITECDDTGTPVPVDISTATSKQFKFLRDDGSVLIVPAEFTLPASGGTGDGTDGMLSYFSVEGDLTPPGACQLQGIVQLPAGTWHSEITNFFIYENLP